MAIFGHKTAWVKFSTRKPKCVRLYVVKNSYGELMKGYYSHSKGGSWSYVIAEPHIPLHELKDITDWLEDFPKNSTKNMTISQLKDYLQENGLYGNPRNLNHS